MHHISVLASILHPPCFHTFSVPPIMGVEFTSLTLDFGFNHVPGLSIAPRDLVYFAALFSLHHHEESMLSHRWSQREDDRAVELSHSLRRPATIQAGPGPDDVSRACQVS